MVPRNTSKIILFLLKNPNEFGYNINQIAKVLEISVGSAFKILKDLEKDSIATHKGISNASYYKLNLNNREAAKICELLLLSEKRGLEGYAKIYAKDIMEFDSAEIIILFGSILKGKEFNDVDVLFVTGNIKRVNNFCLDISKIRTKPLVPFILKKDDLINEIKNRKDAIVNIIKEGVVLKGESEFIEAIKHAGL